jgi:Ca2+-binding EF-hand superfamily protein
MKQEELLSEQKLQTAFSAFDTNGDGSIDKDELLKVFGFSDRYNLEMIEQMIAEVDKNNDNQI